MPVHLLVDLTIQEGKLEAFKSLAQEMIARTRTEPGTLEYEWHLSGDSKRCRLIETYVDADAVLAHLTGSVVQQLVPKMLEHTKIDRFESCGDPGPQAANLLGSFGAEIFKSWHGLRG